MSWFPTYFSILIFLVINIIYTTAQLSNNGVITAGTVIPQETFIPSANAGGHLFLADDAFFICFQGDLAKNNRVFSSPVFSNNGQAGVGPFTMTLQKNGNLVVQDSTGAIGFSSNTPGLTNPHLEIDEQGRLKIIEVVGQSSITIWKNGVINQAIYDMILSTKAQEAQMYVTDEAHNDMQSSSGYINLNTAQMVGIIIGGFFFGLLLVFILSQFINITKGKSLSNINGNPDQIVIATH